VRNDGPKGELSNFGKAEPKKSDQRKKEKEQNGIAPYQKGCRLKWGKKSRGVISNNRKGRGEVTSKKKNTIAQNIKKGGGENWPEA